MRPHRALALCAALLPSTLAAGTPSPDLEYFLLQVHSLPAKGRTALFNNQFVISTVGSPGVQAPTFVKDELFSNFWALTNTTQVNKTTTNDLTAYSFYTPQVKAQISTAQATITDFQGVNLVSVDNKLSGVDNYQNGWYINGTSKDKYRTLEWTDKPSSPTHGSFFGWIGCEWWLGVPQLFWITGTGVGYPLPTSCEAVQLNVIPITK